VWGRQCSCSIGQKATELTWPRSRCAAYRCVTCSSYKGGRLFLARPHSIAAGHVVCYASNVWLQPIMRQSLVLSFMLRVVKPFSLSSLRCGRWSALPLHASRSSQVRPQKPATASDTLPEYVRHHTCRVRAETASNDQDLRNRAHQAQRRLFSAILNALS
jgi:hypothetical protein